MSLNYEDVLIRYSNVNIPLNPVQLLPMGKKLWNCSVPIDFPVDMSWYDVDDVKKIYSLGSKEIKWDSFSYSSFKKVQQHHYCR